MGGDIVPLHREARAVAAEDGVRRVVQIPLRVVAQLLNDLPGVVAALIAPEGAAQPAPAAGIGGDILPVFPHLRHRRAAGEQGQIPRRLGRVKPPAHLLHVGHGASQALPRQLQAEVVPRLQQHALRPHQALADRTVGGLAEVAALCVLEMGPAGGERDFHIRDR